MLVVILVLKRLVIVTLTSAMLTSLKDNGLLVGQLNTSPNPTKSGLGRSPEHYPHGRSPTMAAERQLCWRGPFLAAFVFTQ